MKDIYKNPILYYIAVPVLVGLWPLLVWAIYLPSAENNIKNQQDQYKQAEKIMMEILTLDPDRLEFVDPNNTDAEFTYANAVREVALKCGIPPSKYELNSGMIISSREQKSQNAKVDLKQIDIVTFANFLSMIQFRWADLQCERVKLTKKKGVPDMWDVDIEFKYYY
jgi:hypothetical protein